ncbi:hypothetical protein [Aquiflexum balticum]|nr:hypothetical protein [Aquiflexum balticum]
MKNLWVSPKDLWQSSGGQAQRFMMGGGGRDHDSRENNTTL